MCLLKTEAMDRTGELPMEKKMDEGMSKRLANLSGAAVRGEPVAMTDVDRLRMPKRAAFMEWAKERALDVTETTDAWGNREFIHPHIESIWFGWFHAPSASAPVAGSEQTEREKLLEAMLASEKRKTLELQRVYDERGLQIERLETALYRAALSARAADAPSEPSERMFAESDGVPGTHPDYGDGIFFTLDAGKSRAADALDSQPTDGEVRNG